ncbi:MAG: DUF4340 domain-containing protein [Lachnospiraceae bacterium]|nr:DUF4340 domain-containing protein [Lachnospiraceae bacterium]
MKKQKKQLMILCLVLVLAIVALVLVFELPTEEAAGETQSYSITTLDQEAVNKLSFTNDSGTCQFTRQDDVWIYDEDKTLVVDETIIERMIGKLVSLTSTNRIEDVEDVAQYGFDEPAASIRISDGTTEYMVLIGDYNNLTGDYYLCLESEQETVYTTDSYTVTDFLENSIDTLTVQEEEPETTTQQ